MNIDLEKTNNVKQFLFIDETDENNSENSNNKFYILNKKNNHLTEIKDYEIRQLYTQSKEELKSEISNILSANTEIVKNEISELIDELLNKKINNKLAELNIIHFAGEVSELPISSTVGQVFILNEDNIQSYYICTEQNTLQRILLESDLSGYLSLNEYKNELSGFNSNFRNILNNFESYYKDNFLTVEELQSELSSTQAQINYLSGIISNFIQ